MIIACGCSFTYGVQATMDNGVYRFTQIKNHADFLSEKTQLECTNLSYPGGSNYCIAKQVEYAIAQQPKLIVFNTTTTQRYDLTRISENVDWPVTLNNFEYPKHNKEPLFNGSIKSKHLNVLSVPNAGSAIEALGFNNREANEISSFILQYQNENVKRDQDRLYILAAISMLKESRIPYVCVDTDDLVDVDCNIIKLQWLEYCKQYPLDGDLYHWNELGHGAIAEQVYQMMSSHLT